MSNFTEKSVWSNLIMFEIEILQEIVTIHFFWHGKNFASFSGHTLSVEIQTNRRLKLPKYRRYSIYEWRKFTVVFIAREIISVWSNSKLLPLISQLEQKKCFAGNFIDKQWSIRFCIENRVLFLKLWENVKILFLIKVQVHVTRDWNHLHK